MLFLLLVILVAILAGSIWLYSEVDGAPLGEETEGGLRIVWINDRPETQNVSCVWKVLGESETALPSPA
jgi:hypothetical protein